MTITYHRPSNLDEAVILAASGDAVVLGGGTVIGGSRFEANTAVIDLQDTDLAGIEASPDSLTLGAMTRLTELAESDMVPEVLADLARRELPRSLRNSATIGGTVATAHPESQLLAGLLAYNAIVSITLTEGSLNAPLAEVLASGLPDGGIITALSLDPSGAAAVERTARTPGDTPIVCAVAHATADSRTTLALSGVAQHPITVAADAIADLDPPGDFRGSSEYRRHLASVLADRVLSRVGGAA